MITHLIYGVNSNKSHIENVGNAREKSLLERMSELLKIYQMERLKGALYRSDMEKKWILLTDLITILMPTFVKLAILYNLLISKFFFLIYAEK